MPDYGSNIWDDLEDLGDGVRGTRLLQRAKETRLRAAVWEIEPGATQGPYHVHHGTEELLLVLRGHPTLRTPDGERELKEGEAVHFPAGPTGAHQLTNRSDEVARVVIAASHVVPEIVEYIDEGEAIAWSVHDSLVTGKSLEIRTKLRDDSS
jgi:uncharacterized cupin superfamily protein